MGAIVVVPKYHRLGEGFSRREQLQALEHPGRRTDGTQSAASFLADLTDLRKMILLCSYCRPKFNPRRHRYRRFYSPDFTGKTDGFTHNGQCDGCKQQTALLPGGGTSFVAEETYQMVCLDPMDARRKARAAAGAQTAWQRVKSMFTRVASPGAREAAARKGA